MREIKFRAWDGKYKKYYMDNCDFIIERAARQVFFRVFKQSYK